MWLQDGSTDVSIRAICGMGGIGKTTIAKFVYNKNSNSFDSSSFLANIREVSEQPNGLLCLQRQLISDVSKRKHRKIHNVDEGLAKIENILCSKRVLLVLADVEQADQKYAISRTQDWLFPGSIVFITTRNERLLKPHQIYKVEKLGQEESIKLFSFHAFGEDFPLKSYTEQTKRAITLNFLGLPNHERLILKGCVILVEVYESIGTLEMLDILDLQDCRTLSKLPRNIGNLGSLKTIIISGYNIGEFPTEM
ncbi:hypothetical protein LguiA_008174 [Lonicera macranthoides]